MSTNDKDIQIDCECGSYLIFEPGFIESSLCGKCGKEHKNPLYQVKPPTPPEKAPQSEPSKEVGVKADFASYHKEACDIAPSEAWKYAVIAMLDDLALRSRVQDDQVRGVATLLASQAETIAKLEKQVEEMRKQPEELPQCGNCDELEENCTCKS